MDQIVIVIVSVMFFNQYLVQLRKMNNFFSDLPRAGLTVPSDSGLLESIVM